MRKKPYTEKQLVKIPCVSCGKPSFFQWQLNCCAAPHLRGSYFGVCPKCDIKLNKHTLEFRNIPDKENLLKEYKKLINDSVNEAIKDGSYKKDWNENTKLG